MTAKEPASASHGTSLQALRLVVAVIAAGGVVLSIVRAVAQPSVATPGWPAILVTLATLVAAALLLRWVGYDVPTLPLGLPKANAMATSARYYASSTILRAAIASAPVIAAIGISLLLEPSSWLVLLLALPGSLALVWLHAWPSARTASATADALEAGGAPSHLFEAMGLSQDTDPPLRQ